MTHHNNIYVKSGEVSSSHSDGTLRSATPTKAGDGTPWHAAFNMRGNIIASAGPAPLFTSGSPAQWALSTFDDNLYYRKNHPDELFPYNKSLADWQAHGVSGGKLGGQDKHSIVADPKFKDAAQGDYTLLPDSPALAHGFTQIDMSTVGPRPAARPLLTAPSPPPSRPHLVHVVVDDLGWHSKIVMLSRVVAVRLANPKSITMSDTQLSNPEVHSPNIVALAKSGITLMRHYTYRYCSPTRCALLSGRLPHHVSEGNYQNDYIGGFIHANMTIIADKLKQSGYKTHHVGKCESTSCWLVSQRRLTMFLACVRRARGHELT